MLVIEIAAGIVLGLLIYRGIDYLCAKYDLTVWQLIQSILVTTLILGVFVFGGLYVYDFLQKRANTVHFVPSNNLPPNPPGYAYIRSKQKEDMNNLPLFLQKGTCVSDCDTDHSLWLIPKAKQ
jgi:hypothetical protein